MGNILITGHRGWIGSTLTSFLDRQGVSWMGHDYDEGDLKTHLSVFREKLQHCHTVVHLAATARIPPSWQRADHYRENNVGVTDQIARVCAEENKYLIFSSSSSIYGDGQGPLNPYAWSKLAGEQSIEMYGRSKGLRYTILRFFTNYGGVNPDSLVIGKWLRCYKQRQPILLRGTGEQSRDFIHVEDTAEAVYRCVNKRPYGEKLDIGTGVSYKLADIARLFESNIITEPELMGYSFSTRANIDYTKDCLNWYPKQDLMNWIKNELQTFKELSN